MKTTLPTNPVPDDSSLMVAPVICTSHLAERTCQSLRQYQYGPGFMGSLEHGELLYVPNYDERIRGEDHELAPQPDLETLFSFLAARRYRFVRLDSDGDEIEGLPVYDWE